MTYKMTDEERQLHESEERNVQLRKNALIAIHSQRVLNELDSIGSDAACEAIDYCNTPNGLVQLRRSVECCSAYDTIADLMIELAAEENEITYPTE